MFIKIDGCLYNLAHAQEIEAISASELQIDWVGGDHSVIDLGSEHELEVTMARVHVVTGANV